MTVLPPLLLCTLDAVAAPSGASARLAGTLRALAGRFQVDVLAPGATGLPGGEALPGVRLLPVPVTGADLAARLHGYEQAVARQVEGGRYVVAHFTDPLSGAVLLARAAPGGTRCVYEAVSFLSSALQRQPGAAALLPGVVERERRCLLGADLVVTGSPGTEAFIRGRGGRTGPLEVLPTPADLQARLAPLYTALLAPRRSPPPPHAPLRLVPPEARPAPGREVPPVEGAGATVSALRPPPPPRSEPAPAARLGLAGEPPRPTPPPISLPRIGGGRAASAPAAHGLESRPAGGGPSPLRTELLPGPSAAPPPLPRAGGARLQAGTAAAAALREEVEEAPEEAEAEVLDLDADELVWLIDEGEAPPLPASVSEPPWEEELPEEPGVSAVEPWLAQVLQGYCPPRRGPAPSPAGRAAAMGVLAGLSFEEGS